MRKTRAIIEDSGHISISSPVKEPAVSVQPAPAPSLQQDEGISPIEMQRRIDEIDQLTADYILSLVDCPDAGLEDFGIEVSDLETIEDAIEDVLHQFGVTIYRPTIVEDDRGVETIVFSRYDEYDE